LEKKGKDLLAQLFRKRFSTRGVKTMFWKQKKQALIFLGGSNMEKKKKAERTNGR